MRKINLHEHQRSEPHPLSAAERDVLAQTLDLSVQPVIGADAVYHLTPGSTVGAVDMDGLSVLIRPKMGIPQLLSLSCYAMSKFKPRTEMFDYPREYALPDVLALALASAAGRAFSRGLLHGYRTEEEALHTVRGRIRFNEQIRRRFGFPLPVEVRYDDFTDDILENRLVKAAARRLARMRLRSQETRRALSRTAAILDNVLMVEFPSRAVPEVRQTQRALPRGDRPVTDHPAPHRLRVRPRRRTRLRLPDGHERRLPGVRDGRPPGGPRPLRASVPGEQHLHSR